MKKIVHVVYINNFFPEMWKLTFPTIQNYASRIGAKLNVITERKFPDWHIHYEKVQVYNDGKFADANFLVDADVMIHPSFPDFTAISPAHHVSFNDGYRASDKFMINDYFLRDGRDIGIASNAVISYKSTHDLWEPLRITPEQGKHITIVREGDIDEYMLSHNLAKYGLRYTGITWEPWQREYFVHIGTDNKNLTLSTIMGLYKKWKLDF